MKEVQSRMQEEIRMIREALGLVSCCWCPQEGAGLLLPSLHHPASPCGPCPLALGVTQCEGHWERRVGTVSQ